MIHCRILKQCHLLCVCAEGRGKTEATEKAAGVPETGPSTLSQNLVATARPGAMETPHSAQTSQRAGKSLVKLIKNLI